MYYLWRNFTATRLATREGEYQCSSCSFAAPVWILGVGSGVGHSPYLLDDAGAAERAREAAEAAAESDAEDLRDFIGCASCPSCGRVDRRSLVRFCLRGAFLAAAAAGVFVLVGVVLPMIEDGPVELARAVAKLGVVVALAFIAWTHVVQWIGIQRRITFVAPEQEAVAPKKKKKKKKRVTSAEDA